MIYVYPHLWLCKKQKADVYFNQVLVLPKASLGPGVGILLNINKFKSINIRQGHFVITMDQEKNMIHP